MRTILTGAAVFALAAFAWGAQPATTPAKKTTAKPAATPPPAARKAPTAIAGKTAPVTTPHKAAPGPATSTAVRKTATPVKPTTTVSTATATHTATAAAHKPAAKKAPIVRTTWRTRQAAPTPDRYKEIQTALVARGYLTQDAANGAWDQASADALKKFQADQNIDTTGKINSLSLIALGLGPHHDSAAATKPLDAGSGLDR